jgi:hypothetical protein
MAGISQRVDYRHRVCCACTTCGHAAAPPRSVMNSRRFTALFLPCFPRESIAHATAAMRDFNLAYVR